MVTRKIIELMQAPIAAAVVLLSPAAASAGLAGPVGHSANEWSVPLSTGPFAHSNNERPVPLSAGPLGHAQNDDPLIALPWAALGPWPTGASPGDGGAARDVTELLDRSSAMPADFAATSVMRPNPGGAVPSVPIPAPGAVPLLGLALLAGPRRRRRR